MSASGRAFGLEYRERERDRRKGSHAGKRLGRRAISAVGDEITLADCFLVPQIRNALLAEIDLPAEFPLLNRIWENMLPQPEVISFLEEAGGIVQPLVFDAEKFESYAEAPLSKA